MKRTLPLAALALLACLRAGPIFAQVNGPMNTGDIKWGPAPAALPAGAQAAVLQGDPMGTGMYTVRLRMPSGYRIPPHYHRSEEVITVISGKFHLGMGDTFSTTGGVTLNPGGFVAAMPNQHHYAWTEGETVVQISGMGPFEITYVNPADNPSRKQ